MVEPRRYHDVQLHGRVELLPILLQRGWLKIGEQRYQGAAAKGTDLTERAHACSLDTVRTDRAKVIYSFDTSV
jgi:hypothetical protein